MKISMDAAETVMNEHEIDGKEFKQDFEIIFSQTRSKSQDVLLPDADLRHRMAKPKDMSRL